MSKISGVELLDLLKEQTLDLYLMAFEMSGMPITDELIDDIEKAWSDITDYTIMNDGDIKPILLAGLEILIDTSIEEEILG